jgi:sn-glycerol 3-phosphate transport system substrate-binding protein
MRRRSFFAGAAALALARPAPAATPTAAPTRVLFWHAMNGALGEALNRLIDRFNRGQGEVEVVGVFKGGYPETLTAAIAAWRAGQAPHLVQVFDVGTGSMVAAGPAVKDVWQLVAETGVAIGPERYIASVRGYYSLADGRMASMPFNSSTAVMWYNQDAFEKAGLDPAKPPATWPELVAAAETLKRKNVTQHVVTTSWPTWIHFEQFAAIHNLPYATEADGFKGLDARLLIDAPGFAANLQRLLDMAKAGTFKYAGRDNLPDPIFYSGQAAITFNSSAARGALLKSAKFRFADAYLPYDPAIVKKPINSIIGGASLWAMTAPQRTLEEYRAAARFLAFLGQPAQDAEWAAATGYVPVTFAGADRLRKEGFFARNPGTELPILQLQRLPVTDNSRGIRLGNMAELRVIIEEEWEKALGGGQDAKAALANAVSRGDAVLKSFQRAQGG